MDRDALRSGRIEADHSVSRNTGVGKQCLELISLFASEEQIAAAVLGGDRLQEWRQMAPLLEQKGLPKIDQLMGGRYMPAVHAFFDRLYGLDRGADAPLAPDGVRIWKWSEKQKPPQLIWDRGVPIWRATRAAIKAGLPGQACELVLLRRRRGRALCALPPPDSGAERMALAAAAPIRYSTAPFAPSSTSGRPIRRAPTTRSKLPRGIPMTFMRA